MRFYTSLLLLIALSLCAQAQKNNSADRYFAFDANWNNISNIDSATYFSRIRKISDTCYEVHNYHLFGPMISKEVYKDAENKIAHGTWVFYKPSGYMDSICTYRDNLAHGSWYFINDTNRTYLEKVFENGRLKAVHDLVKLDSINKAKGDSMAKVERDEKESEFRGGVNYWVKYLQQNLRYPERAIKNETQGMVVVQFVVDTEGNIAQIELYKSVEYALDDEAKRLIIKSPKWSAATQDGRKVKSYKRQPIVFRLR